MIMICLFRDFIDISILVLFPCLLNNKTKDSSGRDPRSNHPSNALFSKQAFDVRIIAAWGWDLEF
jgi:hypothetical protein